MLGRSSQRISSWERVLGCRIWRWLRRRGCSAVYDCKTTEIATAVELLLGHRDLTLQDPDVVAAALAAFKAHPTVRFSDCLMPEIARKAGHLPLGTFGRHLAKLDGAQRL